MLLYTYCLYFKSYVIFYSFRCEIRVYSDDVSSSSSSILLVLSFLPHPLLSFTNVPGIFDSRGVENFQPLQLVSELKLSDYLGSVA